MSGKEVKGWQPEQGQWLVFRTDTQVQSNSVDIYVMLQIPTLYAYGFFLVQGERPKEKEVRELLNSGFKKDGRWARKLTLPKDDPAEKMFREIAEPNGVKVETQPGARLEPFAAPFKEDFARTTFSPAGMFSEANFKDDIPEEDKESAKASIPDSYDPCPCASGKKYKFCCKKIFREVIMAMCASEEGRPQEALTWMAKAQSVAGESAEVLCRYGIIYSRFDKKKAEEYFEKCLRQFPEYPRAHYIRGIDLKEKGDTEGALASYHKAIERYLPTDRYHLNEVWNNVGTIHFDRDEYEEAKTAWEKALVYLPSDGLVKRNLIEFIYTNPDVPEALRKPSPFVERFMSARERK
jgi:tetratricopeptide (TPR) repeat protein